MYGFTPSTPSAAMAAGVFATGNSTPVAAFTLLSVVCAESITATRSSKGEPCTRSGVGGGFAARWRGKIAARVAGRMAGDLVCLLALGEERGTLLRPGGEARAVGVVACAVVARCGRCRRRGQAGARHHRDAVDRAGRDAQLAAGAQREHHGVHLPLRTDDRIDRAGWQAAGAADAGLFVDLRYQLRPFGTVGRVERQGRAAEETGERLAGWGGRGGGVS